MSDIRQAWQRQKRISYLKCGDVLLYKPAKRSWIGHAISWLSLGGQYCHAAVYIGNSQIIESHMTTGVHQIRIKNSDCYNIDIWRLPRKLSRSEEIKLTNWYVSKLDEKYDLAAWPSTFSKSVLGSIFGFANFRKSRPILNNDKAWYCSELVSTGYYKVLNINLVPELHFMCQTPSDLARGVLERVTV